MPRPRTKPAHPPQPRTAGGQFASRRAKASIAPGMDATHRAASPTDAAMRHWTPPLTEPNAAHSWERDTEVARTRDIIANNGHAAAAVDQAVGMQVGVAFRFSPRHELMAQRLGISVEAASTLASQIEQAWTSWANDPLGRCDWEGQLTFGGLTNLAARHLFIDGEAFGVMRWDSGGLPEGWRWRTSLMMVDPDRCSNPIGSMNNPKLVNGIETDGRWVRAYHFRDAHPADRRAFGLGQRWERVPARDAAGRPIVLHLHRKTRAGQKRGVSKFIAVLRAFKQLDKYSEAELSSALLNALFGAQIKTSKTGAEAAEALGVQALLDQQKLRREWYNGVDPRLSNGARVAVLAPGDELNINATPRHVASFQGFVTTTLQGVAAGLGLAASQLTMDFSKTNFSSWRGEMLQVWRLVLQDREMIANQFCTPALICVIEEAIENGDITVPDGCPGLYENTAGWTAGRWIGPSRGTIDPTGEVDGANKRVAGGFSTLEDEAMELGGNDYQAVAGQSAYERDLWSEKGLTPTALREMSGQGGPPGSPAPAAPQAESTAAGDQPEPTETTDGEDAAGEPPAAAG